MAHSQSSVHTDSSPETKDAATESDVAEEAVLVYPKGFELALIMIAISLTVFLVSLDTTISATAIPKITDQFHSLNDIGWYGSAYMLTTASFQLLFGRFYTHLNLKWVYLAAVVIFELGSLICGVAPNSKALIVGRAVAGLGASGLYTGSLIVIANTVPLEKRPMFNGLINGLFGIASVVAPLLGGAFAEKSTWRWCFYINLPIGGLTILTVLFFFKPPKSAHKNTPEANSASLFKRVAKYDPIGTAIFIPAIVCLLLALQWGGSTYAWKSGHIIGLLVTCFVLLAAFVGVQFWAQENATVPPRILTYRSVVAGCIFSFCLGSANFVLVYFLPVWFQAIKNVSAIQSGINSLPMIIALAISAIITGGLLAVVGYYTPFMIFSSTLMAVGAGLMTTFKASGTSSGKWIGFQVLFGFGFGAGMQQSMMAVQTVLDMKDVPTGVALLMFIQTLGGALFVSVAQNVFTNRFVHGIIHDINNPDLSPSTILNAGATSIRSVVPATLLGPVLEVYNSALVAAFYVAAAMAALSMVGSLLMEWRSVKGKKKGEGGGEVAGGG
ncbi:Major facilitator superfamily transporter [Mycena kentingensis (nom. inval.)]|nr:Major facilitator superfamily transporter [Mycena kentingensis (nom. inval.)]